MVPHPRRARTDLSDASPHRGASACVAVLGREVPRGAAAVGEEPLEAAVSSGTLAPDAAKMVGLGGGGLRQRARMERGQGLHQIVTRE